MSFDHCIEHLLSELDPTGTNCQQREPAAEAADATQEAELLRAASQQALSRLDLDAASMLPHEWVGPGENKREEVLAIARSILHKGVQGSPSDRLKQVAAAHRFAVTVLSRHDDFLVALLLRLAHTLIDAGRARVAVTILEPEVGYFMTRVGKLNPAYGRLLAALGIAENRCHRYSGRATLRAAFEVLLAQGATADRVTFIVGALSGELELGCHDGSRAQEVFTTLISLVKALPPSSPERARRPRFLAGYAEALTFLRKFDEAYAAFAEAERACGEDPGDHRLMVAEICRGRGLMYYGSNNYAEAEAELRRSVAICQGVVPQGYPGTAQSHVVLSHVLLVRGDISQMLRECMEAERIVTTTGETRSALFASIQELIAYAAFSAGAYSTAIGRGLRAWRLIGKRGGAELRVRLLSVLGLAFGFDGKARTAHKCFARAMAVAGQLTGPAGLWRLAVANNQALVAEHHGDLESAWSLISGATAALASAVMVPIGLKAIFEGNLGRIRTKRDAIARMDSHDGLQAKLLEFPAPTPIYLLRAA